MLPGWGQRYNGKPRKGAIYTAIVAVSAGMVAYNWDNALGSSAGGSLFWSGQAWTRGRNNWLILGAVAYTLAAVDAYVDAHLATFDVGPVSFQPTLLQEREGAVVMVRVALPAR